MLLKSQLYLSFRPTYFMDFAQKQLEKYGWVRGKGLGKNENGIVEALKPKLKRNLSGIGHDAALEFTDHWWESLYDKAASNVQVVSKNGKLKTIKTHNSKSVRITNSTFDLNKCLDKNVAVLTSDGMKRDDSLASSEKTEDNVSTRLSDEQLFAACQGRTAHKGARHGLKARGKLARIEEQERSMLKQDRFKEYTTPVEDETPPSSHHNGPMTNGTDYVMDDYSSSLDKETSKASNNVEQTTLKKRRRKFLENEETNRLESNTFKKKRKKSKKLLD